MINGGHIIIYSRDAEADRVFFRDVLEYRDLPLSGGHPDADPRWGSGEGDRLW